MQLIPIFVALGSDPWVHWWLQSSIETSKKPIQFAIVLRKCSMCCLALPDMFCFQLLLSEILVVVLRHFWGCYCANSPEACVCVCVFRLMPLSHGWTSGLLLLFIEDLIICHLLHELFCHSIRRKPNRWTMCLSWLKAMTCQCGSSGVHRKD